MENINMFPKESGFLFPNGEFFSTDGKGHERLAYRLLKEKFNADSIELRDPEYTLQSKYSAILIRYRWGGKLVYLPIKAPKDYMGKYLFKKAIDFYSAEGYQIINLYNISLEDEYFIKVETFIQETFEEFKFFSKKVNYTSTIILGSDGRYLYNPERDGD